MLLFAAYIVITTVGAINNVFFQTSDEKIVRLCRDRGYLNIGQDRIKCSLEEIVVVKNNSAKP